VRTRHHHVGRREDVADDAGKGASGGAAVGGGAGLLAGIGAIGILGLGPVVATGWLVSTLIGAVAGAAAGAATGGLIGSLTGAGVPEREAHVNAEACGAVARWSRSALTPRGRLKSTLS
jgi:hypothetical protein